jgi:hypothetical protein
MITTQPRPRPHRDPRRNPHLALLLCGGLVLASGCFSAKINVVDERTALENQILGSYQALDSNLQLLASVRDPAPAAGAADLSQFSPARRTAIAARQTQQFNRDDVDELKGQGCLGEGQDGLLSERPCEASRDPVVAERLAKLLPSENQARATLFGFVIASSPELNEADLPQVVSAFARIQQEQAQQGAWIQAPSGEWAQKN